MRVIKLVVEKKNPNIGLVNGAKVISDPGSGSLDTSAN